MSCSVIVAGGNICVFLWKWVVRFDGKGCVKEGAVGCNAAEEEATSYPYAFAARLRER